MSVCHLGRWGNSRTGKAAAVQLGDRATRTALAHGPPAACLLGLTRHCSWPWPLFRERVSCSELHRPHRHQPGRQPPWDHTQFAEQRPSGARFRRRHENRPWVCDGSRAVERPTLGQSGGRTGTELTLPLSKRRGAGGGAAADGALAPAGSRERCQRDTAQRKNALATPTPLRNEPAAPPCLQDRHTGLHAESERRRRRSALLGFSFQCAGHSLRTGWGWREGQGHCSLQEQMGKAWRVSRAGPHPVGGLSAS